MMYSEYLNSDQAKLTMKSLDYLDGYQLKHVEAFLNDPQVGRKKWKERGIVPRYRNITQMVVEKSGLLFIDSSPEVDVYDSNGNEVESVSTYLRQILDRSDWIENFINIDSMVRLLKTVLVLIQLNPEDDSLIFDILHQGNSAVMINPITRDIDTLIYRLSECHDEKEVIRVITKDTISDYAVDKVAATEELINQEVNPYGIIPAVKFNDTRIPRNGFWNPVGYDLVQINELYNISLCDSEYSASWAKLQQLFTNAPIVGNSEMSTETVQLYGNALPSQVPSTSGVVGGPGTVIQLESPGGGESIFCQYMGPDVNLQPLDDMVNKWIGDFAADWSVNVKSGSATATSGFQLVVEEIDNITLRNRRQRMFESGFHRMYQVLSQMLPGLPAEYDLYVEFEKPRLPIDTKEDEEVWTIRISEGRASKIDYLMSTQNLTRDEAVKKLEQIQEDESLSNQSEITPPMINTNVAELVGDVTENSGVNDANSSDLAN